MVFLAPMEVFWDVYKKKTTGKFKSLPYVVGLYSSMLWIYYAMLKGDTMLMITIRAVGIILQTFYLCVFIFYAPKKPKMKSWKLIFLFIVIGFGLIVILTQFLTEGDQRVVRVGWVFLVLSSLCAFIAPLGGVIQAIKTKSVECMSILSILLVTLSSVTWFFYGILLGDISIVIPNVLGFTLGVIQIIICCVYKTKKPYIDISITEINKEQKVKDPNKPDMVIKLNVFTGSDNVANPHYEVVAPSSVAVNHANIEGPA
ncbi:bidirectional sugar transporter SWEET14-like [Bidens hawaiensis]|uniref:bidirectional sugar transporter SWEET14-like n=1 Tax=Bidens hawaiensis TaxID=980011 RepID=UPI00404B6685